MHCTNCGTALSADTSFCANCGTPKGAPAATQAQPVVVNNNPYVQAAPATGSPNSGINARQSAPSSRLVEALPLIALRSR